MIKLITCDIDGTLLKDYSTNLNPSLFELIKKFKEKGVYFVAASGRQLPNLKDLFAPIKDDIDYIAENGALVCLKGEIIQKSTIEINLAKKLAKKILEVPNLEILICCANTTYIIPKCPEFAKKISEELKNHVTIVKSLEDVSDEILKIAVYQKDKLEKSTLQPFIDEFGKYFHHTISGLSWYDFMTLNTNKGVAIEKLQEIINVTPDETASFGDNFNDIEMLSSAKYSYAMIDAHEDVKKCAKYICKDVEETLKELYNKFYE